MNAGRRGVPFVVAAPSGTGKTTVCRRVVQKDPLAGFSVSHTTPPRRHGEGEGFRHALDHPFRGDDVVALVGPSTGLGGGLFRGGFTGGCVGLPRRGGRQDFVALGPRWRKLLL